MQHVELLLDGSASVLKQSDVGLTALGFAVDKGYHEVTKQLLAQPGIELETRYGPFGRTPLIAAASSGHIECVRELLLAKADPFRPDKHGKTPEEYALDVSQSDGLICPQGDLSKRRETAEAVASLIRGSRPTDAVTTLHREARRDDQSRKHIFTSPGSSSDRHDGSFLVRIASKVAQAVCCCEFLSV